ncbi:MAG: UMP kinase [Methanomicrobiales archaeon]|nr:UMP kinase [Methanomicrobiales archaeon]
MKRIVISLGGSVLVPSLGSHHISRYADIIGEISQHHRLCVVVGGGGEARRYIETARTLGISEAQADEIGIMVTRLNAALLAGALGEQAYPRIPSSYEEAKEHMQSGRILVAGGMVPGQTTDAVAAILAEYMRADLILNATSVDGIYSADPRVDPDAKKYSYLTPQALLGIISGVQLRAGSNTVFDILAAKVVERSGIPLAVIDGRRPENIRAAIMRGEFEGTIVSSKEEKPFPL